MHKHRKNTKSERPKRKPCANRRISESASKACRELLSGITAENDPAVEYLRSEYLSKYLDPQICPASERKANAIVKWLATDRQNAVTNCTLRDRDPGYNILPRVSYSSFLRFARRLIAEVLGPIRDELVLGSFSGGASTSRDRSMSTSAHKLSGQADTTATAEMYVGLVHHMAPMLRQYNVFYDIRTVEGAKLFTVPKKTDIDRCACKEPDINMFLQKGVGRHIRQRLRRHGINLNDQTVNRKLAQVASIDDSMATLDLSSASDTITIECVRALLPTEWFDYLNDIRSQSVEVEGMYVRTEMFSSMGNGFTFELESLIFWALVRTTCYFEGISGIVSVYGDDVICPSRAADMVSWVFHEFGFTVNQDKSFSSGPFRESCGGHYHNGTDITPFYLKQKPMRLTDVIRICNQLRRWALADPVRQYVVPSTYKVWTQLAQYVPRDLWGGHDLSLDTQLVAPVSPINRLVRLTRRAAPPEQGRYLSWHVTNWNRANECGEPAFPPSTSTKRCRRRPARIGAPFCSDLFYEEIVGESGPR